MDSEFEDRLRRQSPRPIPAAFREEILAAASQARLSRHSSPVTRHWLSTIHHQLSTLLWPHPKAWAGLAAIWVFIFVLNFSTRDKTPALAEKVSPPSPEVLVELKKQQRMFAELMGSTAMSSDADRQKFIPKPRSERAEILVT
jgi:hypothetical protein